MEGIYGLKMKNKTPDWYKSVMEAIVPFNNTNIDSYNKKRMIYAILNNDISLIEQQIKKMCRPEGEMFVVPFEEDREIVVYNRLYPKYMYLVGQKLKRGANFDVVLNSDRSIAYKNEQLKEFIEQVVDEEIGLYDATANMPAEEAQKYYEQMKSLPDVKAIDPVEFKTELEIFTSDVIEYFKNKFDYKYIETLSFKHILAQDMGFVGIIEQNGQPVPMVFNPLHFGFNKSSDEYKVEKGDFWWYRTPITVAQAYDELMDKVEDEVMDRLGTYAGSAYLTPNATWDVTSSSSRSQYNYLSVEEGYQRRDYDSRYIGQSTGSGSNRRFMSSRLLWKTYLQFKAFKEVVFVTSINNYGVEVTDVMPANYDIPKQAIRIKFTNRYGRDSIKYEWTEDGNPVVAEKMWIPRRYEVTRYGSDIYVDMRECPNQPLNIDNPSDFELSAKGRIFSGLNAEPMSLVERAIPSLLQYIYVKDLQNRELAKYEGFIKNIDVSQIPDQLAIGPDGQPLYEGVDKLAIWRYLRRSLGDSYSDPTLTTSGLLNNQKSVPVKPEIAGSIQEIILMQQLLDLIDKEMGLQMLVPPQAEGIYSPSSNVTDNQQAIVNSYTMAEEYFLMHNDLLKSVIDEYVIQFREYYRRFFEDHPDKTETFLNYNTPSGSKRVIKITPEVLSHEDLGIFIKDGVYNETYRKTMESLVHALAQNRAEGVETISELVMALSKGESPETVHKMITLAAKRQEERMQQMQQAQSAQTMEIQRMKMDEKQMDHQNKLEQITLTKEFDKEIKAIDIFKFAEDKNQDKDGVPDYIEAMKTVRELNQKDRELDIKEKDVLAKRQSKK